MTDLKEKNVVFVVNTALHPHFVCVFNANGGTLAEDIWHVPKEDGKRLFDFFLQHADLLERAEYIGFVDGPGSFSSLRASECISHAFFALKQMPIRQVSGFMLQQLLEQAYNTPVLLNTFGNSVFLWQDKVDIADLPNETYITTLIPEKKAEQVLNKADIELLEVQKSIYGLLQTKKNKSSLEPVYFFGVV